MDFALVGILVAGFVASGAGQITGPQRSAQKTTAEIASLAKSAVVTVEALGADGKSLSQGSGFVVRADGVVITNWHVLKGATDARVTLNSGEVFRRVTVLDGDPDLDIALLKVPGFGLPVLPVTGDIPPIGSRVIAVGSPLGLTGTVSEGIVSATRVVDGRQLVQTSAPISHGSSGGPMLDSLGRVFAISSLSLTEGQQLNFGVPAKYAMGLLDGAATPKKVEDVFKGAGPSSSGSTSGEAKQPVAPPAARSANIRPNINGTYVFRVGDAGGVLVYGNKVGLAVFFDKDKTGEIKAEQWSLQTLRTNQQGEVALGLGGVSFSGFQTEKGFAVKGTVQNGGQDREIALDFERYTTAIANNNGLYDASVRTHYLAGSYDGGYMSWSGDCAIVVANDEIFVDLYLANTAGGSTGIYGRTAISADGRFDLISRGDGVITRLTGTVRTGELTATWSDTRKEGATYSGTLTATRK